VNIELVEGIPGTDSCITFDPVDKIIYLRKFITNHEDPEDNLGGYYVMKKLPRGKPFEKMGMKSAEMTFIKKKIDAHPDFKMVNLNAFYIALEEALDTLIMKYMEWLDGAEERRQQEREQEEAEREEELEMLASDGEAALEEAKHPIKWIADTINWFTAGERMNILYAWITYCSQIILDNPISVIGIGEAGSGKSHILETAMDLIPPDYVLRMKSATMAATYAMAETDPYYFDKKIVYIGDMGGSSDHEEAEAFKNLIKELQTDGEVKRVKMVKGDDGEQVPKWFELYGYPCLTYTNVPGHDFDGQELSRSVMLSPRSDNDQAVAAMKHLYSMKSGPSFDNIEYFRNRVPVIHKMVIALRQRMQYTEIINPYHDFINTFLKSSKFFKRDFDKYNGILRVITAINGYNRELVNGVLFTTVEDILLFLELLERYHESITANLSPNASDIIREMREKANDWDLFDEESAFTVNDYMARSGYQFAKRSFQQYFSELNANGLVKTAGREGRQSLYVLVDTSFGIEESDIKMSSFDQKMLEYNYGIDCDKLRTLGGHTLPGGLQNVSDPPVWDDLLPENS
jgi:hypothetical protein